MLSLFVTLEGPEGAGKSTQTALLVAALEAAGMRVCRVREPGGTPLGDALRALLLGQDVPPPVARAEALLYCAARAQLVAEVIQPALARGDIVVADRFADSTLAYQGYGRGLSLAALAEVLRFGAGDCWPDLTILLDLPVADGLARKQAARRQGGEWTRFEDEAAAFHERVRQGYLALAAADPARWLVLDAREPAGALQARIRAAVQARLDQPGYTHP